MSEKLPVIALTGATGFVGRKVLEALLAQGYSVRSLVRSSSRHKVLVHENVHWVEGVLGDAATEGALVKDVQIVIHMAGLITTRKKSEYERVNANAVGSLAKAAQTAGVNRFVYLSSLAAKAPDLSWYAWSKHQGELALAQNYPPEKSVMVHAPAVFGAGDKATAPIYKAVRNGFLPAPGGRKRKSRLLSLIYVDDLAGFLVDLCANEQHDGKTVSPSTIAKITWSEFAQQCAAATDKKVKPMWIWLSLLYLVAGITTLVKAMTGKGHLTLGKLNEFLYDDWSVEDDLQLGTDLQDALRKTIQNG